MKKLVLFVSVCIMFSITSIFAEDLNLHVPVKSALLVEAKTGTVLYDYNSEEQLVPASLVKIMTLLLTFEYLKKTDTPVDKMITISRAASRIGGRQVYLKEGEELSIETLIKSTAIFSANDAAYALAELVGGNVEQFVQMMNAKAAEFGLEHTHFVNPHGLPETGVADQQYTSARDLVTLARYMLAFCPEVFDYTGIQIDYIRDGQFQLLNTNKLLWKRDDVFGLKTGYVNASGFCVVNTARQNNMTLISVVMGAPNKQARFSASNELLSYGFDNFLLYSLEKLPHPRAIRVEDGAQDEVSIRLAEYGEVVLPRGGDIAPDTVYNIEPALTAPVEKGHAVGEVKFIWETGQELVLPLETAESVALKPTIWRRIKRYVSKFFD